MATAEKMEAVILRAPRQTGTRAGRPAKGVVVQGRRHTYIHTYIHTHNMYTHTQRRIIRGKVCKVVMRGDLSLGFALAASSASASPSGRASSSSPLPSPSSSSEASARKEIRWWEESTYTNKSRALWKGSMGAGLAGKKGGEKNE